MPYYIRSIVGSLIKESEPYMIYFTENTEKLFGKEPKELVTFNISNFSRNSMYFGVIFTTLGIGFLLGIISEEIWGILVVFLSQTVVIKLEKLHLKKKHGTVYEYNCNRTPPWIEMKRIKSPNV